MQPAPLNVDCAPRRAASEATGRCRSAPEARGFAPVCTRRRGTPSLRCARARHDTSLVIARCSSSRVARHDTSLVIARCSVSHVARHHASRVISACMQPAPLNVDPAPRRAASEATGRCRSAPEARGFAPVCNRRRGTASLRCARARHDTSSVMTRRVSSAPACNRRRRTATPLRDEPRAKRPADVDRRRKHEASRRCALGAGGLRPFAALGLVMTRRVS